MVGVSPASPDIVCLVESWSSTETTQVERVAQRLGVEHQLFVGDWEQDGAAPHEHSDLVGIGSGIQVTTHQYRRGHADST
jgi:hypothetical protein